MKGGSALYREQKETHTQHPIEHKNNNKEVSLSDMKIFQKWPDSL